MGILGCHGAWYFDSLGQAGGKGFGLLRGQWRQNLSIRPPNGKQGEGLFARHSRADAPGGKEETQARTNHQLHCRPAGLPCSPETGRVNGLGEKREYMPTCFPA